MELNFYSSESINRPIQIDAKSSQQGVYIRICVKKIQTEDQIRYSYLEAFVTTQVWQQYQLVAQMQGIGTLDAPTIEYIYMTNVPVEYPVAKGGNSFTYKPIWAKNIYMPNRAYLVAHPEKLPYAIYDSTNKIERMQKMDLEQYDALTSFLDEVEQKYFENKKAQQAALGVNNENIE